MEQREKLNPGVLEFRSLADDPLLRLSEVARALGVSHDSVRRYVRRGLLPGVKLGGPHGFYKVRTSRVLALLKESMKGESDAQTL
jgi:excisionase family DNA binding protein